MTTPEFRRAYADFKQRALATGEIHQPIQVAVNPDKTVARIDMPLAGNGEDAAAYKALNVLRKQVIPPVLNTLPLGTQALVTGDTAGSYDFNQTMKTRIWFVFAFVLGLAFLLLLLTFRSIVIPIKAILLNLLSVGAAYGVLVWIFQYGHLEGLLNFKSNGGIVTWLPLFLFTVLFGLSMDYHVFILSRVKELVDRGVPTDEAVARGHPHDRVDGDERRRRHGRRVRDLRDAEHARHQADGRRPRRRRAARRDDHPRRPAARGDEAARRLELVPAALARVAADA